MRKGKKKRPPAEGADTAEGPITGGLTPREKTIIFKPPKEVKFTRVDDHPILQQMLASYVEDWKRAHSHDKKPRLYFYVSDAGRCGRMIVYQFLEPEKKHDMQARTIVMFRMGDLFHEEIQDRLRRIGVTTSKDIEFGTFGEAAFDPRGRLDFMFVENDAIVISDIKSKNSFSLAEPPSIEEALQLMIYIYQCKRDRYFTERYKKIADYGYLLYADRGGLGDAPFVMWRVEYDEELMEAIRAWFSQIHVTIKAKILPDRPYVRDSIACTYCRFKDHCWADIPVAEAPAIVADGTIAPPAQEIVESMSRLWVKAKAAISEAEKEVAIAEAVLLQYFKATAAESLDVDPAKILYKQKKNRFIDEVYLLKRARKIWHLIAKPQIKLLEQAVKDGHLSGTMFERAMKVSFSPGLVLEKPKAVKAAESE